MPKWLGKVLGIRAGTILLLGATGYWYVFIAGAPQLDPPKIIADADLKFERKTYKSAAMNSERTYGLILPPGYAKNPKQRYPVIFLLHGGHGDARAYQDKAAVTSVLHDLYKSKRLPPQLSLLQTETTSAVRVLCGTRSILTGRTVRWKVRSALNWFLKSNRAIEP